MSDNQERRDPVIAASQALMASSSTWCRCTKLSVAGGGPLREALDRRDGRNTITHSLLIEFARSGIGGVIFQRCKLRALLPPPVFGRPQQPSTDALTAEAAADRDFRDVAEDHLAMHDVFRAIKPGIDKTGDLPR